MSNFMYRNSSKTYFFNTCFDKNQLKNLISWFIKQAGEKVTVDFLETLKQLGFHQATVAGVSLGLDDLEIPSQKSVLISQAKTDVLLFEQQSCSGNLTSVEKSQGMISTWNQTSELLRKNAVHQFKSTNPVNPVYMMAFSGARGNISQVRQLVAMRGLMADPQGVIVEFPIQSNFREGLTLTEYLISCFGARKGLVDTALRTATSGYLTRRLVDAAQHIIVCMKDCETLEGFRLPPKDLEHHLIGRVLAQDVLLTETVSVQRNQLISPQLAKLLAKKGQQVVVRSPLTCQSEHSICQLCYGWNLAQGDLVSLGEAVGVIAAQSIGEPGTQLTMRTFHTGGVGVFSDQAMNYFFSPYDGIVDYAEGLPGHFVRTPNGKIVYMIKNTTRSTENTILKIGSLQPKQIQYVLKKQDLPPGSILLVKQGEYVQAGQVVAQSANFKKSKQKMPESTHPVFSPLAGEVLLEPMLLLKQNFIGSKYPKFYKKPKKKGKQPKLIGPDLCTFLSLGNFWVVSSQNQQEYHVPEINFWFQDNTTETVFRPGDLVSPQSRVFHYDFFIAKKSCFQSVLNKPCLGLKSVELSVEKINFHKVAYSVVLKSHTNQKDSQKDILFFHQKNLQNFLLWFPTGSLKIGSGYCFNFLLYNQLNTTYSTLESTEKFPTEWSGGSFFYLEKNISFIKNKYQDFFTTSQLSYFLNFQNSGCSFLQSHKQLKKYSLVHYSKNSLEFFDSPNFTEFSPVSKFFPQKFRIKAYSQQKKCLITLTSNFFKSALTKIKDSCFEERIFSKVAFDYSSFLLQEKKGWIFISKNLQSIKKSKSLTIFEQGKIIDNFFFLNSKVCIHSIPSTKLGIIKQLRTPKNSEHSPNKWYSCNLFLHDTCFLTKHQENQSTGEILGDLFCDPQMESKSSFFSKNFFRTGGKSFVYYQIENQPHGTTSAPTTTKFDQILPYKKSSFSQLKTQSQKTLECLFFAYSLKEFSLPKKASLHKKWLGIQTSTPTYLPKSSLFTKQESTFFTKSEKQTKNYQLLISQSNCWFSSKILYKILLTFPSCFGFHHVQPSYCDLIGLRNHQIPTLQFTVFFYNFLSVPENSGLCFDIFENNWVLPSSKLTTGFIKIQNSGEFRRFQSTNMISTICVLTSHDLVTLDFSKFQDIFTQEKTPSRGTSLMQGSTEDKNFSFLSSLTKNKHLQLGKLIRSGTEVLPEIASSIGGLVVNKNGNQVTFRVGLPFLGSSRGVLHVFENDIIQKNDLLVTLKSRRLQTQDIVQGIPKIEQLFEARATQAGAVIRNNLHIRLKKYFLSALKSETYSFETIHTNLSQAVTMSFTKIQFFLVQSILQAYSSQGVKISQKHIEIIVRQMTTRVRIVDGGSSGLLPGELVQFSKIQNLNQELVSVTKSPVFYEPIILGITKSVLQSESFLLAASFQEVSRVLVRSALTKKTDFLLGLHENVILGQVVPTGTGLVFDALKNPKVLPLPLQMSESECSTS